MSGVEFMRLSDEEASPMWLKLISRHDIISMPTHKKTKYFLNWTMTVGITKLVIMLSWISIKVRQNFDPKWSTSADNVNDLSSEEHSTDWNFGFHFSFFHPKLIQNKVNAYESMFASTLLHMMAHWIFNDSRDANKEITSRAYIKA